MSEFTTLARPYARAVFEIARREDRLAPWSVQLGLISAVVADPQMAAWLLNPRLTRVQAAEVLIDVCQSYTPKPTAQRKAKAKPDTTAADAADEHAPTEDSSEPEVSTFAANLDAQAINLIHLLADYGRLPLIPEITALYEVLRADAEGRIQAELISGKAVTKVQQTAIAEALKARLGREVDLVCSIDKNLIGGAIIRAGDLVIDGSVRGQLDRLASTLSR